jgi:hypothetical protein
MTDSYSLEEDACVRKLFLGVGALSAIGLVPMAACIYLEASQFSVYPMNKSDTFYLVGLCKRSQAYSL